jgi:ADP-heptose:LPS heptosyltransferase
MKILVGKTFGIGNLVLAVPMLKALGSIAESLDILIGTSPDDVGAIEVVHELKNSGIIDTVHLNSCHVSAPEYDVAVMAIPFDGRWRNGTHFRAKKVIDGRTRPDPSTIGLVSWEKHEVLYQMENADYLGYSKGVPSPKFMTQMHPHPGIGPKSVYIGLGYKKDRAGFWKFKHWGNENYAKLVSMLDAAGWEAYTTGDMADLQLTINPIKQLAPQLRYIPTTTINHAFRVVSSCKAYIGNDTGMMHVAASEDILTLGIFMDFKLVIKNRPWTPSADHNRCIFGWNGTSPENVFNEFMEFLEEIG